MNTRSPAKATGANIAPMQSKTFGIRHYLVCLKGILVREGLRFLNQRERFISSLVRPLL